MTPNRNTDDATGMAHLDAAWREIEQTLIDMGALIRRLSADLTPQDRYEGYKRVLAMFAENYLNQVQYDRCRPEVLPSIGALLNHSAPSQDYIYRMVHIEPGASYRVRGSRGDAKIVDFQLFRNWWGHYAGPPAAKPTLATVDNISFDSIDIELDAQGNFDFVLSAKPHAGQWWQIDAQVNTLLIRDYFTDYAVQGRPALFHFERIDAEDAGTTVEPIALGAEKLAFFSRSIHDWSMFFHTAPGLVAKVGDNCHWQPDYDKTGGAVDQRYFLARYNVKPDQALVGEFAIPEGAQYWSIALYDQWFAALNGGYRQVNLNEGLAKVSKDGKVHFVISHRDPGIANWLDPDGHQRGVLQTRIKGVKGPADEPHMTLVPFDKVREHLPDGIDLISDAERARQLAVRRTHYHRRENR